MHISFSKQNECSPPAVLMHLSAKLILAYEFQTTVFQAIIHRSARDKNQIFSGTMPVRILRSFRTSRDTFGHLRFLASICIFQIRATVSEISRNFLGRIAKFPNIFGILRRMRNEPIPEGFYTTTLNFYTWDVGSAFRFQAKGFVSFNILN